MRKTKTNELFTKDFGQAPGRLAYVSWPDTTSPLGSPDIYGRFVTLKSNLTTRNMSKERREDVLREALLSTQENLGKTLERARVKFEGKTNF